MSGRHVVVDAGVLVLAVTDDADAGAAARTRLRGATRHAPHLVDAEVGHVLRRMAARRELTANAAREARALADAVVTHRYGHRGPLAERAWRLRENLTYYDALYVALAEAAGCPLLTTDARLGTAPGPTCPIEVLARR